MGFISYVVAFFVVGSSSSASVKPPKVQEQEEIDDEKIARDAKFAYQTTDLVLVRSLTDFFTSKKANESTDSQAFKSFISIREAQHWAVVVHFPKTEKTLEKIYKFEAGRDDKGHLDYSRHDNVDKNEFDTARCFGNIVISPRDLLDKANQVSPHNVDYKVLSNNCQTWASQFLNCVSPDLYNSFVEKLYEETKSSVPDLMNRQLFDHIFKKW